MHGEQAILAIDSPCILFSLCLLQPTGQECDPHSQLPAHIPSCLDLSYIPVYHKYMIQTLCCQSHGFDLLDCCEWTALGKPSDSSFLLDVDNVDDYYVGSNFPGNECTI
jgi:hypothetical protein